MKPKIEYILIFVIICFLISLCTTYEFHNSNFGFYNQSGLSSSPPPSHVDQGITPDYSTSEGKAVFIARLQEGANEAITVHKVELVNIDAKYLWRVDVTSSVDQWYVYVDPKDWISKKSKSNSGRYEGETLWRSFDELKAVYVADFYSGDGVYIKRPCKFMMDGKVVWKVPLYEMVALDKPGKFLDYVYFDLVTGKSKRGNENWKTLKELDEMSSVYENSGKPYKNMLRSIYPE